MLKSRNIVVDTQFFLDKRLDFDHAEFRALRELVNQDLATVHMTDITEREIRKKIKDELTLAFNKLSLSELRYLNNVPLYKKFRQVYTLPKLIDVFEGRFLDFVRKFKVKIIKSTNVDMLSIFNDYCDMRPPFNDRKGKKAEFPDAIALSAIAGWAKEKEERAYLLSKDNDWVAFAENSYILWGDERYFEALSELPQFTDLILRTEESLKDIISFAELLLDKRSADVKKKVLKKVEEAGFDSTSISEDVCISDVDILDISIVSKQVLECNRDGAVFSVDFECTGIFGYDVTDTSNAIWDNEDKIYRGDLEYSIYQKQRFAVTAELEIGYMDGLENNFIVKSINVEGDFEIDYDDEDAETVNLKEWNQNIPVEICGVEGGQITSNGHGSMQFDNFEEARKAFPSLDIIKASNEFTAAIGARRFKTQLRFETLILNRILSG